METNLIKDMAIGALGIFNLLLILAIRSNFPSKQKSDQHPVDIQQDHCCASQHPLAENAKHGDADEIDNQNGRRTGSPQIDGQIIQNVHSTSSRKKYVSALLILHGVNQTELAKKIGVSQPLMSSVVTGRRRGVKKKGKAIRQAVADTLGMRIEDLWPEKAA